MADTDTETLPNGTGALSEEDERLKQRPADIDADVREMERRKRVEALMSSKLFREELERVLDQQMHEGNDGSLLQRIREMVGGRMHTGSMRGPSCVLPINDIRGIEGVGYEKGEKILRCKLAAVYRLVDLFGWTQTGITGQITARLNTAIEQVLTSPRGLLPHEVTASSLVKVDMQGNLVDQGTTNFPVNIDSIAVHLCVLASRPDIRCVVHVRSACVLCVSSTKRGLQPISEEAAILGDVAYHRLPYGSLDNAEREKLIRSLGPRSLVLFLQSNGALCCGATLEEAFFLAKNLVVACEVQLRLASVPHEELQLNDAEYNRQVYEASRKPPSDATKWRVGGEEFEALMRMLDNAGFRTGYIYRHPLIKNDVPKPKNDVEVPPAVSSLGYLLEEEELYRQGIWRKGHGKTGERSRWLNSPNVYQKVEVLETGTNDPKKITKWVDANNEEWVQDGSPAHNSTPVKINTLQFVPKNTNPKEFKALQQQIKENRRADKITSGPQSHILEGVTWDEASKLVGEDAANTHTGDHVVLMGAASKGIIQRGYQHNATMYSAPYARNPFDHVTDNEIDEYTRTVHRKQRSNYDTDLSECEEGMSAAQITSPNTETEDESRDEHRVLRIETKQAPVRSQPEVVLSDVDTTDFLNAERSHAERTRDRDPALLSDDEVFLSSAASTASEALPLDTSSSVRAHMTAITRSGRGMAALQSEVLSTNKRSKHEYSRTASFENISKRYNSPENSVKAPKCKVSLNSNYEAIDCVGNFSSRSSLYSIPSIEWDGRCKSEFAFRSQSLPRQKTRNSANKLYRTRSHSGFINSHIKDPEPCHFHLPKCRSCGNTNYSYSFDADKSKKMPTSFYLSLDDIPQKCYEEEYNTIKIKENIVPVFQVAHTEFVETQEFTEDNYIGDIGDSFASDDQTVIEKKVESKTNEKQDLETDDQNVDDVVYKAELVELKEDTISNESINSLPEGEYHSFSEVAFGDVYDSPLKDLVIKDIRDYSVPIEYYCDDYPKKVVMMSPLKNKDTKVLEPILEESKSSYGDDSGNASAVEKDSKEIETLKVTLSEKNNTGDVAEQLNSNERVNNNEKDEINDKKDDYIDDGNPSFVDGGGDINNDNMAMRSFVIDIVARAETAIELKREIVQSSPKKITKDFLEQSTKPDSYFVSEDFENTNDLDVISLNVQTAMEAYSDDEIDQDKILNCVYENVFEILSSEAITCENVDVKGNEISTGNSIDVKSLDSTVEFEKYEVVTDLLMNLLNKIDFQDSRSDAFVNLPRKKPKCLHFETLDSEISKSGQEIISNDISNAIKEDITNIEEKLCEVDSNFSITKMIENIEQNINLNDTILTEVSDTDNLSHKIVESVLYYVINKVYSLIVNKHKAGKPKKVKKVITIADNEDILYTAACLWSTDDGDRGLAIEIQKTQIAQSITIHENLVLLKIEDRTNSTDCLNKDETNFNDDILNKMKTGIISIPSIETIFDSEQLEIGNFDLKFEDVHNISGKVDEENNLELENTESVETIIHLDGTTRVKEIEDITGFDQNDADSEETNLEFGNETKLPNVNVNEHLVVVKCHEDLKDASEETPKQSKSSENASTSKTDPSNTASTITIKSIKTEKPSLARMTSSVRAKNKLENTLSIVSLDEDLKNYSDQAILKPSKATTNLLNSDKGDSNAPIGRPDEDEPSTSKAGECSNPYDITNFDIDPVPTYDSIGAVHTLLNDYDAGCSKYTDNDESDIYDGQTYYEVKDNDESDVYDVETCYDVKDNEFRSIESNGDSFDSSVNVENKADGELKFGGSNATYTVTNISKRFQGTVDKNSTPKEIYEIDYTISDMTNSQNTAFIEDALNQVYYNLNETNTSCDEFQQDTINDTKQILTDTYVVDDMNTAFVSDKNYYSRSSSPKNTSAFESCCESPIKIPSDKFIGDDLSVLYETNTLLGSPFVKQASVVAMRQKEHSGGIKYWVSFDESLTESTRLDNVRPCRNVKKIENKIPSFVTVDFSDNNRKCNELVEVVEREHFKPSSVLLDELENTVKVNSQDSYMTASQSFQTCEDLSMDSTKKKLIYDTKHSRKVRREYNSWPPFEDTLFYKIISKFRMSESFDPSDFDSFLVDSSL